MIDLADRARNKLYSSLELEEISSVLELFENDQVIIALEPVKDYLQIHWASHTAQDLLDGLEQVLTKVGKSQVRLRIDFVPPEFETILLAAGFASHSEYIECWLYDLPQLSITSTGHFTIRPIQPGEEVEAAVVTQSCRNLSRGFEGEDLQWVVRWLQEPHRNIFFAIENGMTTGVIFTGLYAFDHPKGTVCWVRELAVIPPAQGRGVGRELILASLKWGLKGGAVRSFLMVDCLNQPGIHLYKKLGYQLKPGRGQINLKAIVKLTKDKVMFEPDIL